MRKLCVIILIALVSLLCQSCTRTTEPISSSSPPDPTPGEMTVAEKSLLESTNRFGLKLFGKIADQHEPEDNIFISPLSVSFALGMCYNGGANETRDAIASTLELSGLTVEEVNQSYRNVINLLTQLDPAVVFNIANSIWYRMGFPVSPDFIDLNHTYFDAETRELDFNQPWAADTINHWVDVHTEGKITEIIKSPISSAMVMFLINALYFNGSWTLPFDTAATNDFPFYRADGSTVMRPLMWTDTVLMYFENDLFQAVDLPYGDEKFSMAVLLPKESYTADDIIAQLNDQTWPLWVGSFAEAETELYLPRFKFAYEITLNEMLMAMGMEIAFDPFGADFSNMVTDMSLLPGNLFVSFVRHKTFVQVDEKGTEAAAVTAVGMGVTSMEPMMVVNHPFLFVIHEHETGAILFMGKVADPVWE